MINGHDFTGARPIEFFRAEIDAALAEKKQGPRRLPAHEIEECRLGHFATKDRVGAMGNVWPWYV